MNPDNDTGLRAHANAYSIVPKGIFEKRIDCGAAPVWFLLRSQKVIENFPPRPANTRP